MKMLAAKLAAHMSKLLPKILAGDVATIALVAIAGVEILIESKKK